MVTLSEAIARRGAIDNPRLLQPAVFLAQQSTGAKLYRYRLTQGRVLSDELDQDMAQLEAAGVLTLVCSTASRRVSLMVTRHLRPVQGVTDQLTRLERAVQRLLEVNQQVLEAAATLRFLDDHGRGSAARHLAWLNQIPREELDKAALLAQTGDPA
jgi:hypothetical protein